MNNMKVSIWLLLCLSLVIVIKCHRKPNKTKKTKTIVGPSLHMDHEHFIVCENFTKNEFRPSAIFDDIWYSFFSWGQAKDRQVKFQFLAPTKKEINYFQKVLDPQVLTPIDWSVSFFYLKEISSVINESYVMFETGKKGLYLMYSLIFLEKDHITPNKASFKQTGDNKYLAVMICEPNAAYVLSRSKDMPVRHKMADEAVWTGLRPRFGRSVFSCGRKWMPVSDEECFSQREDTQNAYEHLF